MHQGTNHFLDAKFLLRMYSKYQILAFGSKECVLIPRVDDPSSTLPQLDSVFGCIFPQPDLHGCR